MACALLAGLAGQVSMLPREEALEVKLLEREETIGHLWTLYEGAHCNLREAQIHLRQWVWRDWDWWPDGDTSGIACPWEDADTSLFASAEDAPGPEGEEREVVADATGGRPLEGDRSSPALGLPGSSLSRLPGDEDSSGPSRRSP